MGIWKSKSADHEQNTSKHRRLKLFLQKTFGWRLRISIIVVSIAITVLYEFRRFLTATKPYHL